MKDVFHIIFILELLLCYLIQFSMATINKVTTAPPEIAASLGEQNMCVLAADKNHRIRR